MTVNKQIKNTSHNSLRSNKWLVPNFLSTPNRDFLYNIQTPQIFKKDIIIKAYELAEYGGAGGAWQIYVVNSALKFS